jgi:L-seryl-tRNA(Ser) seleniumtransferase
MDKGKMREIPSVDELLRDEEVIGRYHYLLPSILTKVVRGVIDCSRSRLLLGEAVDMSRDALVREVAIKVDELTTPGIVTMVNASGVVLHSNLGRAIFCDEAREAVNRAASGAINLEYDLKSKGRGERDKHVEHLICELTNAEAACVVNNNAAAVLITLNTLAEGSEVIISRGELVEIGGSFRLPDVITKSGCILKEVGTTNRTHAEDYTKAVGPDTALFLKAHKSNFNVEGFTSEVSLQELVSIGADGGLPVFEDLGSGALVDLTAYGLKREPLVSERIGAGVDLVSFSGDKLLGGPQAGIIAGKKSYIDKIRKNPLKRALRVDKLTLSALEATLCLYLKPKELPESLPTLRYLSRTLEEIENMANLAKDKLTECLGAGYLIEVEDSESQVGSGALPGQSIPTKVVSITHTSIKADDIFDMFLSSSPPILGRVSKGKFFLDMRMIEDPMDVCPERL